MRYLFLILLLPSTFALAQMGVRASDSFLDPYKKPIPQGIVVEQDQGGIPTDGTAMRRQLHRNHRAANNGPTWVYREPGRGKPTFITGPNGTTVCTDANGRVTVCW